MGSKGGIASKTLSALGISLKQILPMETKRKPPSGPFLAQDGANLCSVLRGKVAPDTQRLTPGLSSRCPGRDYRLMSARFSNEREHTEQCANPMLSYESHPPRTSRAQEYRIRVDYDLSRSEDNRPRAKPRQARDKLKRASVEPVSGTEKGSNVSWVALICSITAARFIHRVITRFNNGSEPKLRNQD
jgi:hypothetical protein